MNNRSKLVIAGLAATGATIIGIESCRGPESTSTTPVNSAEGTATAPVSALEGSATTTVETALGNTATSAAGTSAPTTELATTTSTTISQEDQAKVDDLAQVSRDVSVVKSSFENNVVPNIPAAQACYVEIYQHASNANIANDKLNSGLFRGNEKDGLQIEIDGDFKVSADALGGFKDAPATVDTQASAVQQLIDTGDVEGAKIALEVLRLTVDTLSSQEANCEAEKVASKATLEHANNALKEQQDATKTGKPKQTTSTNNATESKPKPSKPNQSTDDKVSSGTNGNSGNSGSSGGTGCPPGTTRDADGNCV